MQLILILNRFILRLEYNFLKFKCAVVKIWGGGISMLQALIFQKNIYLIAQQEKNQPKKSPMIYFELNL